MEVTTKTEPQEVEVVSEERSLAPIGAPGLSALAMLEQAETVARRLVQTAMTVRSLAIAKLTQPEDWILSRDREGRELAMIASSGVTKIRAPYGLYVEPMPGATLEPQPISSEDGGKQGWRVFFIGGSKLLSVEQEFEAIRWNHEKFLGREDIPSDPKMATRTLALTKTARELIGLKSVPAEELKAAGLDISRCRRGSGYGSSQERSASKVAEADVAEKADELRAELLKRTSGDESAAAQLLVDITKSANFKGHRSTKTITQGWQLENAWKLLRQHPVFGDKAQQREPGSD